jgi:hypothetical protein
MSYLAMQVYYKYYHKFWDKQPISKYNTIFQSDGIITLEAPPRPITSKSFIIKEFDTHNDEMLTKLCEFLKTNYVDVQGWIYDYDIDYLKWSLNSTSGNRINLYLVDINKQSTNTTDDETIMGCITARPHKIYINNKELTVLYVDNLCVATSYRKKNVASILISHMAHYGYIRNFKTYIFRKDSMPLPFRFITRFKNTIYHLPHKDKQSISSSIIKATHQDISIIYPFFMNYMKSFGNYIDYSIEEFKYYFINNNVNIYYEVHDSVRDSYDCRVKNMIVLYDNKLHLDGKQVIDIPFIITKCKGNDYELNIFSTQFVLDVLAILKNIGYHYCNINNIENVDKITEKLQQYRYYHTYIHMYNYHLSIPLLQSSMYFM